MDFNWTSVYWTALFFLVQLELIIYYLLRMLAVIGERETGQNCFIGFTPSTSYFGQRCFP